MTSAYEMTTSRGSVKTCFNDQQLDNFNMEKASSLSSLHVSIATSNSSFEDFAVSSVEIDRLKSPSQSSESFDGNVSALGEEVQRMDMREEKDEENINTDSTNSVNDISQINESSSEETFPEDSEKHEEMTSSIFILPVDNISENAFTREKNERIGSQNEDQERIKCQHINQNQRNLSVQERCADNSVHIGKNLRDSVTGDARVHCATKLDPDPIERRDGEAERGGIDRQDDDSFYDAVRSGNAERVSMLIVSGRVQNLDEPDWNVSGDPPLLIAATNRCLPMLSILLASGCDPAVRSPRGETALHRAILNGGPGNVLKFVEDLLKHGCPASVKEAGSGSTALHVLSRQLAHASPKSLHRNHDAILQTLELLAKAGPVNAKDHQGRSALHILASSTIFDNNDKSDIESLIGTLLAAGADTALKNDRGETALHESLECGALNTAMLLISHTPTGIRSRYGETPLHIASRKNQVGIVAKLLEHSEDPGMQDAGDNTPLHLASARGFHETVSLLVTSPLAQLEKINVDGQTALQVATESGFVNTVRILLKAGADPSQSAHYRATILRRHPDISLLIDHELMRRRQLAA